MKIFNLKFLIFNLEEGQALISLLFFMIIGITVVTAAALIVTTDILSASSSEQGLDAYYSAESGVEQGILYVLRNRPNDEANQVHLTIGDAVVTISYVKAKDTNTIVSNATEGSSTRTLSAQATFNSSGAFTISNWKEQ